MLTQKFISSFWSPASGFVNSCMTLFFIYLVSFSFESFNFPWWSAFWTSLLRCTLFWLTVSFVMIWVVRTHLFVYLGAPHPSIYQDRAAPSVLPHLVPHDILVVEKKTVLLLIFLFMFFCTIKDWFWNIPHFRFTTQEMKGNKIFSCHHPFLGLVQATPFCLKKVVSERMTPRPPPPTPTPPQPRLLSLSLSAYTCLFWMQMA